MSPAICIYEPSEPFFWVSGFNHFINGALDSRTPNSNRDLKRTGDSTSLTRLVRPKMDIHESKEKDEITATFELPGMKKEDVSIDIQNNRLTVSGQSTILSTLDKDGYAVRERRSGKFSRTIGLPAGIQVEDIKASMEDGVLAIRFPKSYPDLAPKKITIA